MPKRANVWDVISGNAGWRELVRANSPNAGAERIPIGDVSTQREGFDKAIIPEFLYKPMWGYPRLVNIPYLRRLGASPHVSMAKQTIMNEIARLDWEIIPKKGMTASEKEIDAVTEFFNHPNDNKENLEYLNRKVLNDIFDIDSGVIVKVPDLKGSLAQLYSYDGGSFTKNPDKHGVLPEEGAYWQYGWNMPVGARPIPFGKHEVIYMQQYPRTDSIYSKSPVEILADIIEALLLGNAQYLEAYTNNTIAYGAIQLMGAHDKDIKSFQERWKAQAIRKDTLDRKRRFFHNLPVTNQEVKFTSFQIPNRDLEILGQQSWFSKIVWACFGVTSSELGFVEDSNRAVDINQSKVFHRKAIKPLINLLEWHYTKEIINDPNLGFGLNNLRFNFIEYDLDEEIKKYGLIETKLRNGLTTVNRVLEEEGEEPVEWGDEKPGGGTAKNFTQSLDQLMKEHNPESEKEPPQLKAMDSGKPLFPKSGEEAMNLLEKILLNFMQQKQEEILKELDKIDNSSVLDTIQVKSLFTDFLDRINQIVSGGVLKISIGDYIKQSYEAGAKEVEVKYGFNVLPRKETIDFLKDYTFSNVKGMTDEVANDLRQSLSRNLMEGKSVAKMKEDVKKIFKVGDARAQAIARTESARAQNEGSLEAYRQAGPTMGKGISVALDSKTSELCRRMHAKYENKAIGLDEQFKDDKTGEAWNAPPFHVNCRTALIGEELEDLPAPEETEQ